MAKKPAEMPKEEVLPNCKTCGVKVRKDWKDKCAVCGTPIK